MFILGCLWDSKCIKSILKAQLNLNLVRRSPITLLAGKFFINNSCSKSAARIATKQAKLEPNSISHQTFVLKGKR